MAKTAHVKQLTIKDLKGKVHKAYRRVGSLWCPVVKNNVVFNRYGWIHMSFRRNGRRRTPGDLRLRHHLFNDVHEVVKNSKIALPTFGSVTSKSGIKRKVKYYELVYLAKKRKKHTSAILRKIENGKLHYYSVRRTNKRIKKALLKRELA